MIHIKIAKRNSVCRDCGKKIGQGEGRIEKDTRYGSKRRTFYHLKCFRNRCRYQEKLWKNWAEQIEAEEELLKKEHEMMVLRAI